jgi:hypothetical protein
MRNSEFNSACRDPRFASEPCALSGLFVVHHATDYDTVHETVTCHGDISAHLRCHRDILNEERKSTFYEEWGLQTMKGQVFPPPSSFNTATVHFMRNAGRAIDIAAFPGRMRFWKLASMIQPRKRQRPTGGRALAIRRAERRQ